MVTYSTKDGDVLDQICLEYYGSTTVTEQVLEVNRNLADVGPILPSGIIIQLPDLPTPNEQRDIVRLWG
ncbi:tail protein X [Gammaproteobacteria bacterium AH-315-C21]|nr:tail protein X [Gammaproteobacteria bacterium AH-315-C21]